MADGASPLGVSPRSQGSSSAVQALERPSSIRFSQGTSTISRSPMSRGWRDSDETTPIRSADATADRVYNTQPTSVAPADSNRRPDQDAAAAAAAGTNGATDDDDEHPKQPWYKGLAEKYGSVTLENKGSVARDHLALERTFLAWLRTSLAFASIGIAVTQLFRLNTSSARRSVDEQLLASQAASPAAAPELLPRLQQGAATAAVAVQSLGPTLLDQLLGLSASDSGSPLAGVQDFDEDAARRLRHVGKPLGATFLVISILILLIGAHRYFESQYWVIRGKFPASRGSIFLIAFIAGALIVASLVIVVVLAPTSYEKTTGLH